MKICIFGAASDKIDQSYIDAVEHLGELMGKQGHTLIFGAGSEGLMGAAARGIEKAGGEIYGIVPKFFLQEKIEGLFERCTHLITTETMRERKAKMEDMAEAFIIVPGGIGTFEEMFEIITLKQLGRHNKPIAIYNINNYYDSLEEMMENSMREGFVREKCSTLYQYFDTAEQALEYAVTNKGSNWNLAQMK
jgi:hypothetical protein